MPLRFNTTLWLLLFAPVALVLLAAVLIKPAYSRLAWEYGGMISHRRFVEGIPELFQHPKGALPASLKRKQASLRLAGKSEFPPTSMAEKAARPLAPYTDFPCEYPPGSVLFFASLRIPFDDETSYAKAFGMVMAGLNLATAALVMIEMTNRRGSVRPAVVCALAFSVWVVLLGRVAYSRFDSLSMFAATLGLLAWGRSRPLAAAALLGLGGAIKLWPALLILPVALVRPEGDGGTTRTLRRTVITCTAGLIGFALPHFIVVALGTRPADLFSYLQFQGERPLQRESIPASVLSILHFAGVSNATLRYDYGSFNVIAAGWQTLARFLALIFLTSYGAILVALTLHRNVRSLHWMSSLCGLIVCLSVVTSKVFGATYIVWFLPFCLISLAYGRWGAFACYTVAILILKHWSQRVPGSMTELMPLYTACVVMKNAFCLGMGGFFAWYVWVDRRGKEQVGKPLRIADPVSRRRRPQTRVAEKVAGQGRHVLTRSLDPTDLSEA
jgi:hypothetical protein